MTRSRYAELDPPVRNPCRVLNRFPGVASYTSCGGHAEITNGCQVPEHCWYVDSHIDRTDEGHASLEFFAWLHYDISPPDVALEPFAKPPYLNFPGHMLFYRWSGGPDTSADAFAELLTDTRCRYYVTAYQAAKWPDL